MKEITVVEIIKPILGKDYELKQALLKIISQCRSGEGCLQYDLLEPLNTKGEFLVLMRWKSVKDLERHETSKIIQDFIQNYDGVLYRDVIQTEWKSVKDYPDEGN